jgi:hypothetical protein
MLEVSRWLLVLLDYGDDDIEGANAGFYKYQS